MTRMPTRRATVPALMLAILPTLAASLAAAGNAPYLPDQAVLACHAQSTHAIRAETGQDARALSRFSAEAMDRSMWHVSGVVGVTVGGKAERLSVDCDVSNDGVEVITMRIEPIRE